jgi:hypothetical protein
MNWKKRFHAVLITTPPTEPDRLYKHADGHIAIWEISEQRQAFAAQQLLSENGVEAKVVIVEITEVSA